MSVPKITMIDEEFSKNSKVIALLQAMHLIPEQTGDVELRVKLPPGGIATVEVSANIFMTEAQLERLTELIKSPECGPISVAAVIATDVTVNARREFKASTESGSTE